MFIQAKNYTKGRRGTAVRLIVIHDMEAAQGAKTAENVAQFFANQPAGDNGSSAHCCVDENSIVDCVHEADTAWAAPNANRDGLHIEHAGIAKQSRGDWLSPENRTMLDISASRAAAWAVKYGIPVVRLSIADIRNGKKGFAGHVDITNALCGGQGHTDPGASFPWDWYLARVKAHVQAQNPAPAQKPAKKATKKPSRRVSTPAWYKRLLHEGDRGADVGQAQRRLHIDHDGIYGPKTKAAVEVFQKKHRLQVNGTVDAQTAHKLGK